MPKYVDRSDPVWQALEAERYAKKVERAIRSDAERSFNSRDIAPGWPGAPQNLALRKRCERDLSLFLKEYFPNAFPIKWSENHVQVLKRLQTCVVNGGLFALAMPRGDGKTTITIRAALWAMLYGHRRFVTLVGATEAHAEGLFKGAKAELQWNDRLYADFPEVCYPIRRLEGQTRRAAGQHWGGTLTGIEYTASSIQFPWLPDECYVDGVRTGGSLLRVAGITGAVRGPQRTLPDGTILRPDLAILDDPQTRESAESVAQSRMRAKIISGDIVYLAGPGVKIAVVMPCTVIREGDLADEYLDREKHPEWHGIKTKMLNSMPSSTKLWDEYAEIRATDLKSGGDGDVATKFYKRNQAAMDAGAEPTWPERYDPDCISAVQHAMNRKIRDPEAFFAECQNEPMKPDVGDTPLRQIDDVMRKVSGVPRSTVPEATDWLTAFIDVQDHALFWVLCAWREDFTGYVVDYNVHPKQNLRYWTYAKLQKRLHDVYKNAGREGAILAGLNDLSAALCSKEWPCQDGSGRKIDRLLVDSGHEKDLVYGFCRNSPHSAVLMPSRGIGITAAHKPMTEYDSSGGDRIGHNWVIPNPSGRGGRAGTPGRQIRHVRYDTNYWKTFIHKHIGVSLGDPGSLSLFGDKGHEMFAEHLTSESPVPTTGQGRKVWQWKWLPGRDNHWFDCLVGCAVAASMLGATAGGEPTKKVARDKRKWSAVWKEKRKR